MQYGFIITFSLNFFLKKGNVMLTSVVICPTINNGWIFVKITVDIVSIIIVTIIIPLLYHHTSYLPYFSIDNVYLIYNAHPNIFIIPFNVYVTHTPASCRVRKYRQS
jgi:hypothetical protein